jgi:periplasmic protein TonB
MPLRCLLFSSDEGTAAPILQALAGLDVEGEHCSEAVTAAERVTHQNFQIVIIDWDNQPESGLLLTAARERKAAERPLTLAIVSDDASVPMALQAGANSILRKPILANQVTDTLTTARDLLRAKQESAATAAQAAAAGTSAGSPATIPTIPDSGDERTLRAGEFLQSAPPTPGAQFETESSVHASLQPSSSDAVDPLKDLEPMAAAVAEEKPVPPPPPAPSEPRGLEWYLKARGVSSPAAAAAAPAPTPPSPAKPELLGFDQTPSFSSASSPSHREVDPSSVPRETTNLLSAQKERHDQKKEAELFAYMEGESNEPERIARRFPLKGAIIGAVALAACAIVAAPQAPWHPEMRVAWNHGHIALHNWLNPQPVTPVQAPVAHENFGQAGDEYKLPVAENIPDATTDPSQIHVIPVVDPTIRKPNPEGANAVQGTAVPTDAAGATPSDQTPPSGAPDTDKQPQQATPQASQPDGGSIASATSPSPASTSAAPVVAVQPRLDPPAAVPQPVSTVASAPPRPAPTKPPQPHYEPTPGNVPSSLKSQMASMTPDSSGNRAPETAMQSIEPVAVPEAAERALLTEQPALDYPASGRGQRGTVVLQVLIGRDGSVQDAKFLQGSLAFARSAIDGAKLWKFKPYMMNGRPVSVQTQLTISFKP